MNRAQAPLLIAMAVLLVASACLVALPGPAPAPASPPSPASAQTEGANPAVSTAVFTATLLNPTLAPSITMTAFPSITPLPSATATATDTPPGFVASRTPVPPTPVISPTVEPPDTQEGATDDWGSPTRCSLVGRSPEKWAVVRAGRQYKISWTLLNSGTKTWQANQMVLVYYDGVKLTAPNQKKELLTRDVRVGQTITPVITITTPKLPGHYRSVWALRLLSGRVFCTFTVKLTVE
jgi:hypothetical protein